MELGVTSCHEWLTSDTPPLLIDCREIGEYSYCRIEGATLVPLSDFCGKAEQLFSHPKQAAIIYCHLGVRSLNAVHYLRSQGISHSFSMQGGIEAWSTVIDPEVERY